LNATGEYDREEFDHLAAEERYASGHQHYGVLAHEAGQYCELLICLTADQ
jgi:hypothetical protein